MNRNSRAVSPVVAVILMVAVTVVLSAAIGAFVFDLGQSATGGQAQQSLGVSTSQTDSGLEVTVVTGEADVLKFLVNGEPAQTIENPQPGTSTIVTGLQEDDISIVSKREGEERVLTTTTLTTSSNLQTGLISHYRFGAGEGSIVYDTSGNNDGSIDSATWVNGVVGSNALKFNETNGAVVTEGDINIASEYTVSFWSKHVAINDGDKDAVLGFGNGSAVYFRNGGAGTYEWGHRSGGTWYKVSDSNIANGEWNLWTVTWDGSKLTLYKNANFVGETSVSALDDFGANNNIGSYSSTTHHFNGTIDDVRVYDRPLSSQEVSDLYNATK